MKMGNSRKKIGIFILGILLVSIINLSFSMKRSEAMPEPFFTLVFKTNGGGVRPDYGNFLKTYCAYIGIHIKVIIQDWSTFIGELIAFRDFDICYVDLTSDGSNIDYRDIYGENGTWNMFGYHISMDWDEEIRTGINEWYMKQGTLIMPPDSKERVQHYWAWQQYFMDKICPIVPTFAPKEYIAQWSELEGFDYSAGILQSWGLMDWTSNHPGQKTTNELVIADKQWENLNPLFQEDTASSFIAKACMDPLVWIDKDQSVWPHLAESYTFINDTWLRLSIRQGIKWDTDSEGIFTDEYLDVEDVYFTLNVLKTISNIKNSYAWIKDMIIIDPWTMDIFIDGDPSTPENEPYARSLTSLNTLILPEHYLNQEQLEDDTTPDITHPSWEKFSKNCFGTGFLRIEEFKEGIETTLTTNINSWRFDPVVTADPALNWRERFGFGAGWGGIQQLRIRTIPNIYAQLIEFERGELDLIGVSPFKDKRITYQASDDFTIQSVLANSFGFFAFNMREVRPVIGSREAAPGDTTLTKGLCVRKAIAYAIDRFEINKVIHRREYLIYDQPISPKSGVWCNPHIIRYNYDKYKADQYMTKAGYDRGWRPQTDDFSGFGLAIFLWMCGWMFIIIGPFIWLISLVKSIKHIRNLKKNNIWPFKKRSTVRIISIKEQGYSWKYEVDYG